MKVKHSSKILNGAKVIRELGVANINGMTSKIIAGHENVVSVGVERLFSTEFRELIDSMTDSEIIRFVGAMADIVEGATFLEDCEIELKFRV